VVGTIRKSQPRASDLSRMQQEEAAAGARWSCIWTTRITGRANASRRGSPTPPCRKTNHTPIT